MNKGIQISGGTFAGGVFAAGNGAVANGDQQPLPTEVEKKLLPLLRRLYEQESSPESLQLIEQASSDLKKQASNTIPDKSQVREALDAIGKAEPAIKGVGAIVGSIAALFGLLL